LPGIGRKSAARLAFHLLYMPDADAKAFMDALTDARDKIHECPVCCNLTDSPTCPLCGDTRRDRTTICVVEDPRDVGAIERTGEYSGLYHVLHGTIYALLRIHRKCRRRVGIKYDHRLFKDDAETGLPHKTLGHRPA
ncbi:MAG: recombination protein RecR, partial [Kiritimatiellae bacterium]|nr:recombination protein RecR [Kiritimatiellia bacterium]